jgi:hypothetical protein
MGDWWNTLAPLKRIADSDNCHVILGHDGDVFRERASKGVLGGKLETPMTFGNEQVEIVTPFNRILPVYWGSA